jgi:acyl-CoA reductase-like NAD-dependent aldehyde dehydrogenase
MSISIQEHELSRLVEEVVRRVQKEISQSSPSSPKKNQNSPAPENTNGIFSDVEGAIEQAEKAYLEFSKVSLERRKVFVRAMRDTAIAHAEELAKMAVTETGFGRVEDKIQKNLLAAQKTPGVEDLLPLSYTGDDGLTLVEPAPYGVMGAITPCTNPSSTIINNSISILSAGNAVVYGPHPAAKNVTNHTVSLLNAAVRAAGGPSTLLCSLDNPTLDTSQALMKHPLIKLLLVTGGGAVVKLAMTSGKKCIAAGPGNPPVIVDDTADIHKAARCIVNGASFDNNVLCTSEKEVFVFENTADALIASMQEFGAFLVHGHQVDDLVKVLVEPGDPHPHPVKRFIGQDARVLLDQIGVRAGPEVKLLICELPTDDHPFVQTEMLMPILPIVRVKDLDEALQKAKKAEHGFRHSAMMHSESVSNMSRVAREIETTIFVKNAPSYAGLGFGGEGFTTLSIAGPTGEGLTSARSFTRQRRCVLAGAFRIV